MADTLRRVQRGLEELYRVDTGVAVGDFVIDAEVRDAVAPSRRPREQLLLRQDDGAMSLALFIDPTALANLARHDPGRHLSEANFGDFLLAVEGVSHFIYTILCARAGRPLSAFELELQAEVDKYVTCLLATAPRVDVSGELRRRLFGDACYEVDLDDDEHDRYRAANDNALRYTGYLETTFVASRRIPEMLAELRRFYRHGLAAKLGVIARAG
jgi:hypothetical protein